jgi:uncharacterized protein YecA (UPF0149 family)
MSVLLNAILIVAAQALSEWRDDSASPQDVERIVQQHQERQQAQVEQAVERALREYEQEAVGQPKSAQRSKQEKVRRNDRCPCGSGTKYKKCCGS